MTILLRPLRADEYPEWEAASKVGYRNDMEVAGVAPEIAAAKSERDHAAMLPLGVESEGQSLYAIEDDGVVVGTLWVAERDDDLGRCLFVYNVSVDPAQRGRGVGRAAMVLAEEEARRRGLPAVALNVFGGNEIARSLYRSLGYVETAIAMRKDL